eukprot:TRINITY_DN246_c0_g1_i1.p2 TRINITY_DN246_c0_g1~~TRINITY_DN246_c0_g1_i1.p2  ORF type:complete len:391 (-),score=86.90 TRINITY_DN246_c0_g1_i1:10886-12058(-)
MGKRRRNGEQKKANRSTENGAAAGENRATAEEAKDVDADCIHYASSSEEDSGKELVRETAQFLEFERKIFGDLGSDSDLDFDHDPHNNDKKDNEYTKDILLTRNKTDESDVELSMEFFDPRDDDVSALSLLLGKYSKACTSVGKGKEQVTNSSALAKMVCAQTRVGTTIRLSEDEAPIGFISCVNVREHAKVLKDLKRKLIQEAEKEKNERFIALLNKCMEGIGRFDSERMGLVLCERVVNMPTLVVGKMFEALCCEIEWATEDEKTQEQRDSFKFGWYLYIAEVYCYETEREKDGGAKEGKKKKRPRVEKKEVEQQIAFARVEDSEWHKHASCSVSWDWGGTEDGVKQRRMAMIVAAKKLAMIREAVEQRVNGSSGGEAHEGSAGGANS